jgi:hypothetical protein
MTLPELSIKRYAMAYMLNLVIVLVGVIGLTRIGIDRWPNVDFPIISVTTHPEREPIRPSSTAVSARSSKGRSTV